MANWLCLSIALLTARGVSLTSESVIPLDKYRPVMTVIPFLVIAPNSHISLTLPRWNTHMLQGAAAITKLGRIGLLRVDGSYQYFAEVRDDSVEQLRLKFYVSTLCVA